MRRVTGRPSLETELANQQSKLDELLGAVSVGIRDQRHFDELEERAQAIAANITRAFRGRGRR